MARQNGQKTKLLFLYKLLLERGDEDNPISTPELIEALAARDIPAERKSIYHDLDTLRECGVCMSDLVDCQRRCINRS